MPRQLPLERRSCLEGSAGMHVIDPQSQQSTLHTKIHTCTVLHIKLQHATVHYTTVQHATVPVLHTTVLCHAPLYCTSLAYLACTAMLHMCTSVNCPLACLPPLLLPRPPACLPPLPPPCLPRLPPPSPPSSPAPCPLPPAPRPDLRPPPPFPYPHAQAARILIVQQVDGVAAPAWHLPHLEEVGVRTSLAVVQADQAGHISTSLQGRAGRGQGQGRAGQEQVRADQDQVRAGQVQVRADQGQVRNGCNTGGRGRTKQIIPSQARACAPSNHRPDPAIQHPPYGTGGTYTQECGVAPVKGECSRDAGLSAAVCWFECSRVLV